MFELKIENANGNIVDLNDGIRYEVISANGFTPPSASIFTSKSPNRKGLKYNGSTLNERAIVIQVKLHGDVEQSRNALYDWVDPEQYAKIYYRNNTKNVFCEGYVEVCDIELFTDNEVVNIEILCPDPYLKDLQEIATEITNLQKQFTFPFAISHNSTYAVSKRKPKSEMITADDVDIYDEIETQTMLVNSGVSFSTLKENNITTVFNSGAETGARFIIRCRGDVSNILIFNDKDKFRINRSFTDGWTIIIDTEGSPKTCKGYQPDGVEVNLMRYIGANPAWFSLKKGNNRFGFSAESGLEAVEMSIGFNLKYLGV